MSCEYMDSDTVVAIDEGGRVLQHVIRVVGIGKTLKWMWDAKLVFEALPIPLAPVLADKATPRLRLATLPSLASMR